jgi:hypothetical protein
MSRLWAPFAWWNAAGRQRRVGWLIIALSVFYIFYFLKTRLFAGSAGGGPIMTKEWVYFALSFVGIMLGTVNVRMADMRERNQQTMPLIDPSKIKK